MDHTKGDCTTLGAKLDALDLTDRERAALHAVFFAAIPEEEVAGFGFEPDQRTSVGQPLGKMGLQYDLGEMAFTAIQCDLGDMGFKMGRRAQ